MKSVNRRDFLKLSGSTVIGLTLGGLCRPSQQTRDLAYKSPAVLYCLTDLA